MASYNLLEEKWIDCIDIDGKNQAVSLADLILNAHQIQTLAAAFPIVNNSLMFLVEALLLSVYTKQGVILSDPEEWVDLFEAGEFEKEIFLRYFQTWKYRFNLFDEHHPFFQTSIIEEEEGQFTGTAMKLMPHFSGGTGGNSVTLFDHHTIDEGIALTPKQAVQFLLSAHYYGAGGRLIGADYFSDSFISNGLAFFLQGDNLFETLILNLLPYPEIADIKSVSNDRPIWERENPYEINDRTAVKDGKKTLYLPFGLMDILTWPGRKLFLILDDDGLIRNISMRAGLKIKQDYFPWFAYNRKGYFIRAREGRLMWRDYDILLQFRKMISPDDHNRPPQTIDWLNEIVGNGDLSDRYFRINGAGMAKESGKQKVHFYAGANFPLPTSLLKNEELIKAVSENIETAELIRRSLYGATAALASSILSFNSDHQDGRKPDKTDLNNLIKHLNAESVYWGALEPCFYDFITHLAEDREASLVRWEESIQAAARDALAHAIRLAGESIAVFKASAHANAILEKGLRKNLRLIRKEPINE